MLNPSLSLTPSRLNTLTTLRNTVGNLEAEFTEFKMTYSGKIEQLQDKTVQQDSMFKVQKATLGGLADDLENNTKLFTGEIQNQAALITKLQGENQTLQKNHAKMLEVNVALTTQQKKLEAEVAFLKDQMKALWNKLNVSSPEIADTKHDTTDTSSQTCQTSPDEVEDSATNKQCENLNSTPSCSQWKDDELLVVNIPTSNAFSPLQDPPLTKPPENNKKESTPPKTDNNQPPTTTPASNNNTRPNEVIFLCDSN